MKKFVFIVFAGIFLFGCNAEDIDFDNIKGPTLSGTFGFPLGELKYTMRELIESVGGDDLDLEEDSATSVLTLFYYDTIRYSGTNDLISINDVVENAIINNIPAQGPLAMETIIDISQQINILYNASDGEQLDSIFYAGGNIELSLTLNVGQPTEITASVLSTTTLSTGNPISINVNAPSGSGTNSNSADLASYKTFLTAEDGTNSMVVDIVGQITLPAGEILTGMEEIVVTVSYTNQSFETIYGKFGQDTLQVGSNEIDLGFFNDIGSEGITFGNPILSFDFRNSFGLPINMDLSGVFGDDAEGGPQTFLSGGIVTNPPRILKSTTLGSATSSGFEINNANSNLVQLLANSPKRLVFDIDGITNPKEEDTFLVNFLQPSSAIDAYVSMEIPMEVKLENLEQTDTISLGGGLNISDIDSAFLRVYTINELPFSALLSMDIQDSLNNTLYVIGSSLIIEAPFINVNGYVTDPSGATVDIPFSREGLDALANGSHIVMRVELNTPKSVTSRDLFVKFLGDYSLEIKVGLGGKLNVDL